MKKIKVDYCFAFLGHPEVDSRVRNFASSLESKGKTVVVIGFDWLGKKNIRLKKNQFVFSIKRRPSIFFYSKFLILLNEALERIDAKIYVAEDIYTLPLVYKRAKKTGAKVFYDSRELYNFIGGLAKKPLVQKIIARIEKKYIRKVDLIIVTGEMDRDFLSEHYSLPKEKFVVIRNLPKLPEKIEPVNLRKKFGIPENFTVLIYQGILSKGRGIEKTIFAIEKIPNIALVLIGDGPETENLKKLTAEKNLENKVFFAGLIPNSELLNYTAGADIGVALIENISKSYYYALPNKLFEYFAANLPVIASPLPQMKKIIEEYKTGVLVNPENETEIAAAVKKLAEEKDFYNRLKTNAKTATQKLNWDAEFEGNKRIFTFENS